MSTIFDISIINTESLAVC